MTDPRDRERAELDEWAELETERRRRREADPDKRPFAVGLGAALLIGIGVLNALFGMVLLSNPGSGNDATAYQFLVAAGLHLVFGIWLLGSSRVAYGLSLGLAILGLLGAVVPLLIDTSGISDVWRILSLLLQSLPVAALVAPSSLRWARRGP